MQLKIETESNIYKKGNITNYGIREAKKEQWKCDKSLVRRTGSTNYQDAYVAPDRSAYRF